MYKRQNYGAEPRRGWGTVRVLAKTAREDVKKITEQKTGKKQPGDERDPRSTSKANKPTGLAERGRKREAVDAWLCFLCLSHHGLTLSLPTLQHSLPREKAEKHLISPAQMCSVTSAALGAPFCTQG